MKILFKHHVEKICYGASILGSGGGGDPKILKDYLLYLFDIYQSITLIDINELQENHLIVPIAFVGAPLISLERLPNLLSFEKIYHQILKDYPHHQIVLMPAEIGGCNALTPFVLGLKYQIPILDADLIGRAFPKINMCKPYVLNAPNSRTYLSCHKGNLITLDLQTPQLIENIVRSNVVHFGASAIIATFIFEAHQHQNYIIPGSLSRCLMLAQNKNIGKKIISGKIENVFHTMRNGFLMGEVQISSGQKNISIFFQNEYLIIKDPDEGYQGSPDIIVIIEKKSQIPLSTDVIRYGLDIEVYLLEAPSFWKESQHSNHVDFNLFLEETL